jgi:hypothetical protein
MAGFQVTLRGRIWVTAEAEPIDNSLRIVVEEAIDNHAAHTPATWSETPELSEILKRTSPVESVKGCKTFELS